MKFNFQVSLLHKNYQEMKIENKIKFDDELTLDTFTKMICKDI